MTARHKIKRVESVRRLGVCDKEVVVATDRWRVNPAAWQANGTSALISTRQFPHILRQPCHINCAPLSTEAMLSTRVTIKSCVQMSVAYLYSNASRNCLQLPSALEVDEAYDHCEK